MTEVVDYNKVFRGESGTNGKFQDNRFERRDEDRLQYEVYIGAQR